MPHTGNRLLDSLPNALAMELIGSSRAMDLPQRTVLSGAGEMPAYCYLLTHGAASTVVSMQGGGSSEVMMTGNEGIVNVAALLGPQPTEADTLMQIQGKGYRTPLKVIRAMFDESAALRGCVLQYVQGHLIVKGQISACNRLHEAEERFARWLLTASDATQSDSLELTQEFLAQMLGSQRTTVALIAGLLQRNELIRYSRGKVRILNREGMRAAACDCYRVTREALGKLYV